jgi:hypothetical protein
MLGNLHLLVALTLCGPVKALTAWRMASVFLVAMSFGFWAGLVSFVADGSALGFVTALASGLLVAVYATEGNRRRLRVEAWSALHEVGHATHGEAA